MKYKDNLTDKVNQLIVNDNKTQYLEGKMDGLNIALRDYDSYPNVYCVHINGRHDSYVSILVIAKNEDRALELAKSEAKDFPEFKEDYYPEYRVGHIEISATNEEKTIWCS